MDSQVLLNGNAKLSVNVDIEKRFSDLGPGRGRRVFDKGEGEGEGEDASEIQQIFRAALLRRTSTAEPIPASPR
jgi:hypothetical protein